MIKHHTNQPDFQRRYFALIGCVCLLLFILIVRLFYLQIINHRQFTTLSRHNFLNIMATAPERGLIYDRNGVLLAKNVPSYTLSLIPGASWGSMFTSPSAESAAASATSRSTRIRMPQRSTATSMLPSRSSRLIRKSHSSVEGFPNSFTLEAVHPVICPCPS